MIDFEKSEKSLRAKSPKNMCPPTEGLGVLLFWPQMAKKEKRTFNLCILPKQNVFLGRQPSCEIFKKFGNKHMLIKYDCRLRTKSKTFGKWRSRLGEEKMGKKVLLLYRKKDKDTTGRPQEEK